MSPSPLLLITLACGFAVGWILGDHPNPKVSRNRRLGHRALYGGIAAAVLGLVAAMMPPSEPPEWTDAVTQIPNAAALNQFYAAHPGEAVIVDFYADWCAPCRYTAPIVMEAADEGIPVGVVDVDVAQDVAYQYQAQAIPMVVVARDGNVMYRHVGVYTLDDLRKMVDAANALTRAD